MSSGKPRAKARRRATAPNSSRRCRNLYRFIRMRLGDRISDREIARRWGMEWKSFAGLKHGTRQVPRIHELDGLAALLDTSANFVFQVAAGAPPEEVAAAMETDAGKRADHPGLQTIFNHIPAACIVFEQGGTISAANDYAGRVCPVSGAALVGRKAADVFGDRSRATCPVTRAFLTGRTEQQVSLVTNARGQRVYVHRTAGPIRDGDEVTHVIEVLVDVTAQLEQGDLRVLSLWRGPPALPDSPVPEERRAWPRANTRFDARFRHRGRAERASISNMSTGGVFLVTRESMEIGESIDLSWEQPADHVEVTARGVVVWRDDASPSGPGVGIRFVGIGDHGADTTANG